jgi:methylmalonyl-CoA/ethylmalonyl-CoA epimerase
MAVVVTQVALVVRDLEAAMAAYGRVLGWGPWRVYDFTELPHTNTTVRGEPVDYTMRTAVTRVGGLDLELVEPGEGPSQYQEFLAEHGEGLHHLMCQDDSAAPDDPVATRLTEHGLAPLMSGSVGDAGTSYTYFDGGARLGGLIVETMRNPPGAPHLRPSYLVDTTPQPSSNPGQA